MKKEQGRVVVRNGLCISAILMLLLVQGSAEAAEVTGTEASNIQVLNPFSLRLVNVRSPIGISSRSFRSPRSNMVPRGNALSRLSLSLSATPITVPGSVGKTLVFRNSPIRVPPLISVRSPSQPG